MRLYDSMLVNSSQNLNLTKGCGLMWTKRYLTKPTKEEYFKTKHPIATFSTILPILVYYLFCLITGINNPWMLAGIIGCLILGIGLSYTFAIVLKVYDKWLIPTSCNILGILLIAVSLVFSW